MEIGHVKIGNDQDTLLSRVLVTDGLYETFMNDFFRNHEEFMRYYTAYNHALTAANGALKQINIKRRDHASRLTIREVEDVITLNAPLGKWYSIEYRYYRLLTNRQQGQSTHVFAQEFDVSDYVASIPDTLIFLYGKLFEQQFLWDQLVGRVNVSQLVKEAISHGSLMTVSSNISSSEPIERKVEFNNLEGRVYVNTNLVIERSVYNHLKLSVHWPDFVGAVQREILIVG